jgi:hypothetical protein
MISVFSLESAHKGRSPCGVEANLINCSRVADDSHERSLGTFPATLQVPIANYLLDRTAPIWFVACYAA